MFFNYSSLNELATKCKDCGSSASISKLVGFKLYCVLCTNCGMHSGWFGLPLRALDQWNSNAFWKKKDQIKESVDKALIHIVHNKLTKFVENLHKGA